MISTIIILSILLAASAVVMIIQFIKLKKYKNDQFKSTNARRGIIRQKWDRKSSYGSYGYVLEVNDVILEVKAIKSNSGFSRIKIVKVTGKYNTEQKNYHLEKLPEFIKTGEITFIDEAEIEESPFGIKS